MATYKYSMVFDLRTNLDGSALGARIGGWSESIYANGIFPDAFQFLQIKRAALLPLGARIVGQRIQQVAPAGAAQSTGQTFPGTWNEPSDVPQMALLCSGRSATSANSRKFKIKGIPDGVVSQGEYKPVDGFAGRVSSYLNTLVVGRWQFLGRDLLVRPSEVVEISATGGVTMAAAFTVAAGEVVRIRGVSIPGGATVNKVFKVKNVVNSTNFNLVKWVGVEGVGGTALNTTPKVLFEFGADQVVVNRVSLGKIGRPSGQYRGRASKKR